LTNDKGPATNYQLPDTMKSYLTSLPAQKAADLQELQNAILAIDPTLKRWFLDGKNEEGKIVTNPNIGFGSYEIKYANGSTKEFYRIGLSANTTGISVYIMGLDDKKYLPNTYAETIGKASVTGYCIKFKSLKDIHLDVLMDAITFGLNQK